MSTQCKLRHNMSHNREVNHKLKIFSLFVIVSYLSEIIGKGGLNVRAIQDFTGVKLSVPQVNFVQRSQYSVLLFL